MSIEQYVKDNFSKLMSDNDTDYNIEQDYLNDEIKDTLTKAVSKTGGKGPNRPDFQRFYNFNNNFIPVIIEAKGTQNKLIKKDINGYVDNKPSSVSGYAVNGAVHYAKAVCENSDNYKDVIAVGINGYDAAERIYECEIYYISSANGCFPVYISSDIELLFERNKDKLYQLIKESKLTESQKESLARSTEEALEDRLKQLNQMMHEETGISPQSRISLLVGMIMAGLPINNSNYTPLRPDTLQSSDDIDDNDGIVFINKIKAFLKTKNIPPQKQTLIINNIESVFKNDQLWAPKHGVSPLKRIYQKVYSDVLPWLDTQKSTYLDFTGKLFNILTEWVEVPDGEKNDVVLTPRYVTDMMAKLCKVNKDSYVWDYTTGTAGFLVSSLKLMLADADRMPDIKEREEKKSEIRGLQLLGIEKRADIYILGVLNMILMGDGCSNILNKDSLTDFDGNYEQGIKEGQPFDANVFLLNPPYSAPGKGFIFAEKALNKMKSGRAAILIQENAGGGQGLPFTKNLLINNTLVASIKMADIFKGKAGVQTAIYVFDVGIPHDERNLVTFIDMSNDGYTRQNRKKASSALNLRNTDNAPERYQEVVDIVLGRKPETNYYTEENGTVIKDSISLSGTDWQFSDHKVIDTMPTLEDFKKTVADYLAFKTSSILKGEIYD